ncbi:hypothetical protein EI94DRAFT_1813962 [Lactarius quietus]|nr:hypothetical protein EI94DRAFT_1813962 [Lactarius quietus]
MPSFLSKLLGRKKAQEPESPSDKRSSPTLLDGKFEAVSPTVSPSAALFTDPSSRPSSDSPTTENPATDVPHLSLTLPVTKDRGRTLDVVFEPGHEAVSLLNDATIRERRLSPNEPFLLYAHVLKSSSNAESGDWTWYNTFVAAERTGSFPSDAFSKSLIPQLPPSHTELLLATLDVISSLSAHGEDNGCSGSRLSKFLGLWLLTVEHSHDGDDWTTFYDRWDRAGRILEHLFLARIRDEAHNLPRRLTELVDHYPYAAVPMHGPTTYCLVRGSQHVITMLSTVEDTDLWDTITKASHNLNPPEGTSDLATRNLSSIFLIKEQTHTDVCATVTAFFEQTALSRFPDSPRSPTQVDHGHASSSGQPAAVPSLNANPSTAPTTAAPETPTDWLQFTSQGFGTISPTRDLVATLWDNDVEVTVPPPAPLSRKSSRRAHSRAQEVEAPTTPPRPRASSPRPSLRAETSRLSAAFSFSPKMRFGFFTGGGSDSKSPNDKSAKLPQVGELGESVKEARGEVEAAGKPKESDAGAKDGVDEDVASASAAATAGAVAVAAASAVAAVAIEGIPSATPTEDVPPALTDETGPSVSASITKIDEPVGDQSTATATPQNGHAQDSLIEERRTLDLETVPDSNGGVQSTTTSEPAAAQSEPSISEAKPSQPALESVPSIPYLASISEGPIPQPEFVPAAEITPPFDEVSAPPEPTPVAEELSVPKSSAVPHVDPVAEHASDVEEPKSADTSTLGPVPAAAENQPIPHSIPCTLLMLPTRYSTLEEAILLTPRQDHRRNDDGHFREQITCEEPQPTVKVATPVLPPTNQLLWTSLLRWTRTELMCSRRSGIAETPSVAEASVESSVLKPTLEDPEHPVTKPESEPSVAEPEIIPSIAHDSEEPLDTNGSAQHAIEEPTSSNARADEPVVSWPAVEESAVPPKVDSVEEQLANTSEPEPLVEEAATPALEETVPIIEESESAHHTAVKASVKVETPASTTEAPPHADTLKEPPVPAVEEPLPSSETGVTSVNAEVTSETSIPSLRRRNLFSFLMLRLRPSRLQHLSLTNLGTLLKRIPPAAEIPLGTSAEEPIRDAAEVAPAAEIPVEFPPATGEIDPTSQVSASEGEEELCRNSGAHDGGLVPAMRRSHSCILPYGDLGVCGEESHFAEEAIPTAETPVDTPVPEVEQSIIATDETVHAAEILAPATEEPDHVSHMAGPVPAEPEVLTETPVPATEEQITLRNHSCSQAIAPAEFPDETPLPVAEEPALAPETAPNADCRRSPRHPYISKHLSCRNLPPLRRRPLTQRLHRRHGGSRGTHPRGASLFIEDAAETPSETYHHRQKNRPLLKTCSLSADTPSTSQCLWLTILLPLLDICFSRFRGPSTYIRRHSPVPEEDVPVVVEHPAETTAPVAGESIAPTAEQAALVTAETQATPAAPTVEDSTFTTPAETPAPVLEEPAPVPEESAPEDSPAASDAEQPHTQNESEAAEPVVAESIQVIEQALQEPVPLVDEEVPAADTEEPVVEEPEGVPSVDAGTVAAPEVDAPAEAPVSNGTGARHADPEQGREPEQKPATELDPTVIDEILDGDV